MSSSGRHWTSLKHWEQMKTQRTLNTINSELLTCDCVGGCWETLALVLHGCHAHAVLRARSQPCIGQQRQNTDLAHDYLSMRRSSRCVWFVAHRHQLIFHGQGWDAECWIRFERGARWGPGHVVKTRRHWRHRSPLWPQRLSLLSASSPLIPLLSITEVIALSFAPWNCT